VLDGLQRSGFEFHREVLTQEEMIQIVSQLIIYMLLLRGTHLLLKIRNDFVSDELRVALQHCQYLGLYVGVLISLWLFLFAAQPKAFFLDGLKKLE
jgi:hypothetical protein